MVYHSGEVLLLVADLDLALVKGKPRMLKCLSFVMFLHQRGGVILSIVVLLLVLTLVKVAADRITLIASRLLNNLINWIIIFLDQWCWHNKLIILSGVNVRHFILGISP